MARHALLAAFALLTLTACAASRPEPQPESIPIGASGDPGTEEFHGAVIGADTLRGALPSEN